MRLIIESVPFAHGIIGAGAEVAWAEPTLPDEMLRVVTRIHQIRASRSKPGQALVTIESRTLNQTGRLKQTLTAKVLVFAGPG